MSAFGRELYSWGSAIVEYSATLLGFWIIWYPMLSLGNAVLGVPVPTTQVSLVVGILAFGSTYAAMTGEWPLQRVGIYVVVLLASALGWALCGLIVILMTGVTISGTDPAPQAAVWAAAYPTAYYVLTRSRLLEFQ